MKQSFVVFISLFLTLFAAINYYSGLRTWQAFGSFLPLSAPIFWLLWFLLAASPIVVRIRRLYLMAAAEKWVALISGYWIAITYYALLLWLMADLLRFAATALHLSSLPPRPLIGLVVWSSVALLLLYGSWNARRIVVRHHRLTIAKSAGQLPHLNAVLISDLHLGPIIADRQLDTMVGLINELDADIIFFAGDTIDENVTFFIEHKMPAALSRLKSKYGAYAVLGNHEYIGGQSEKAVVALESAGIRVLRDSAVKIADSFYLVGRDEYSLPRYTRMSRTPLALIMAGLDQALPIILLDHQPIDLSEAERQGVDLQLSGHTHRGQFFPNNLITRKIFAVDWGHLQRGDFQIVVSSGYGTWGPPIRIGSRPEIVQLHIDFIAPSLP
ncbi:MAG: metallophosphoesterase [Negativicutes bacterium]|nr:metallophosphoesterase [Negativicutes bacterium]MDR3591764.1 metallophosphoesterase [Negativicutes bacterium]